MSRAALAFGIGLLLAAAAYADGLRLLLDVADRLCIGIAPERDPDGGETCQDPKHVALRVFLDFPLVFETASDMLAMAARSSLAEYAGLEEGVEAELSGKGRVLVRLSGTEPKARVMIEGEDQDKIKAQAELIAEEIRKALG